MRAILIFIALWTLAANASAALIIGGNYVFTRAELDAGAGPASFSDTIDVGAQTADTGELLQSNGPWIVGGHARASLTGGPRLQAKTDAVAPSGGTTSNSFVRSAWYDALIPDAAGAPSQLSFHFSVHAVLSAQSNGGGDFAQAIVSAIARQNIIQFQNAVFGGSISARVRSLDGNAATATIVESPGAGLTWSSTTLSLLPTGEYEFDGSFVFTADLQPLTFVPDAPEYGAYYVGVGLGTQTSNAGGRSEADAFSTLSLDAITLPDGSALPGGIGFSFESGSALTAIPLPAGVVLMLAPLASLYRRRVAN